MNKVHNVPKPSFHLEQLKREKGYISEFFPPYNLKDQKLIEICEKLVEFDRENPHL